MVAHVVAPDISPKQLPTASQRAAAALSIAGTVISLPAAGFFGLALGAYPFRVGCTLDTPGSGCYEGELEIAAAFLTLVFSPFFLSTLVLVLLDRKSLRHAATWIPVLGLCAVTLIVIAVCAVLMGTSSSPGL